MGNYRPALKYVSKPSLTIEAWAKLTTVAAPSTMNNHLHPAILCTISSTVREADEF